MSVSNYANQTTGTALAWKSSGGDYAITLTSLANASARQGAKGDLGQYWARRHAVLFATALTSAGTNGNAIELYWAASPSATAGTDNPGAASGTDAAFGTPSEYKLQLAPIGSLPVSNNAGTAVQVRVFEFYPPARYGMPVVVNSSGVALSGTAGNHEVRLVPVAEALTTGIAG